MMSSWRHLLIKCNQILEDVTTQHDRSIKSVICSLINNYSVYWILDSLFTDILTNDIMINLLINPSPGSVSCVKTNQWEILSILPGSWCVFPESCGGIWAERASNRVRTLSTSLLCPALFGLVSSLRAWSSFFCCTRRHLTLSDSSTSVTVWSLTVRAKKAV